MKKVFIQTHGCQMNEYDSAKMLDLLGEKSNFQVTNDESAADLLVLNTCSIREKAQERVFHQVGRWKALKEKNPNLKIAIGGCVASQEGEAISKRAPAVDIVFGPQTLHKLPDLYEESYNDGSRIFLNRKLRDHLHLFLSQRAAINIAPSVWFRTQEAMRLADHLTIFCKKLLR